MYEIQRKELIEQLVRKGIKDKNVLDAMLQIERHKFVSGSTIMHAYEDVALPLGYGQTISQPYTVAYMTQELKVKKDMKILEVGTGSGYQAAILEKMGARVYSIERNFDIYAKTQKLFDELGIRVYCKLGDGTIGWEEFAPFNGIIVTAGSPSIPNALLKQLEIGGRLVIPVGDRETQSLKIVKRLNEKECAQKNIPNFRFVPLIGREGWSKEL
ncbi:MAG: protein-L-isoaspartate(D-aspartate) O-methyltransferase [Bacteroidota bacterium]|nr:protein-L-isoaspartate(D-aspartate) O-methyltransferase [Bacteroidota bacterium]